MRQINLWVMMDYFAMLGTCWEQMCSTQIWGYVLPKISTCNWKITGLNPRRGYLLKNVYHLHYGFQATSICWKQVLIRINFSRFLAVANFANINPNKWFCPVAYVEWKAKSKVVKLSNRAHKGLCWSYLELFLLLHNTIADLILRTKIQNDTNCVRPTMTLSTRWTSKCIHAVLCLI